MTQSQRKSPSPKQCERVVESQHSTHELMPHQLRRIGNFEYHFEPKAAVINKSRGERLSQHKKSLRYMYPTNFVLHYSLTRVGDIERVHIIKGVIVNNENYNGTTNPKELVKAYIMQVNIISKDNRVHCCQKLTHTKGESITDTILVKST